MADPIQLTSVDNPRIKAMVRLRQHRERRKTGLFITEGTREITRALAAGLKCVELLVCPQLLNDTQRASLEQEIAPKLTDTRRYETTERVYRKVCYQDNPQAILAVFEQPIWRLNDLGRYQPAGGALWLVAAGTTKPGNLGAMARSAAAAGVAGMLIADPVVDAFNPNAIRASTGTVFALPIVGENTRGIVDFLRTRNARIVAATPHASDLYTRTDLTGEVALVVGPEDTGLSDEWLAHDVADISVRIPVADGLVDSLNASVAAAVLLFEAVRQRRVQ